MDKKAKAEAKRVRRNRRKQGLDEPSRPEPLEGEAEPTDENRPDNNPDSEEAT